MQMRNLHLAPMHSIIKEAGAERVSETAALELAKVLEEVGRTISIEALDFTRHAGRKTVKDIDIRIAAKRILSNKH